MEEAADNQPKAETEPTEEAKVETEVANLSIEPDKEEQTKKSESHKLHRNWHIWYDTKGKNQDADHYEENLNTIGSFNTIEGFWNYYSHLQRPSLLPKDFDYYVFTDDVKPMWENYPKGSCVTIKIKKGHEELDRIWEDLLLFIIGESFSDPNIIGVVMCIRQRDDHFSIWNRESYAGHDRARIDAKLRQVVGVHNLTHAIEHKSFHNNLEHFQGAAQRRKQSRGKKKPAEVVVAESDK